MEELERRKIQPLIRRRLKRLLEESPVWIAQVPVGQRSSAQKRAWWRYCESGTGALGGEGTSGVRHSEKATANDNNDSVRELRSDEGEERDERPGTATAFISGAGREGRNTQFGLKSKRDEGSQERQREPTSRGVNAWERGGRRVY